MHLGHQQSSSTKEERESQSWGFIVKIKLFLFYCLHICAMSSSLQGQDLYHSTPTHTHRNNFCTSGNLNKEHAEERMRCRHRVKKDCCEQL